MLAIRPGVPADDERVVDDYLAIWRSYGAPDDHFAADARDKVRAFIDHARSHRSLGLFLAAWDGEPAGSLACNLLTPAYPEVIRPELRRHGYIWSVYVEPRFGRRGIGRALVERGLAHLRAIGCQRAVLHASDAGAPLYEKAGFAPGREMRIELDPSAAG